MKLNQEVSLTPLSCKRFHYSEFTIDSDLVSYPYGIDSSKFEGVFTLQVPAAWNTRQERLTVGAGEFQQVCCSPENLVADRRREAHRVIRRCRSCSALRSQPTCLDDTSGRGCFLETSAEPDVLRPQGERGGTVRET